MISPSLLKIITGNDEKTAWNHISKSMWNCFSASLPSTEAEAKILHRDRGITELENTLSSSCWDLWEAFPSSIKRCSEGILDFWKGIQGGKAVLILDGMSLRESPWILEQAKVHGFHLHSAKVLGSELPCDTFTFAKALGFESRSSLSNNEAGRHHKLHNDLSEAATESTDFNWEDCEKMIGNHQNLIFWHHFPDTRIHDLSHKGNGFQRLAKEIRRQFRSDAFWDFVNRLATGRRLIITSDHGYAACGLFENLTDKAQSDYMKRHFRNQRFADAGDEKGNWSPPIDLQIEGLNGMHRYVLGRQKWKSMGGYPTLQHGGLSLLEVFVPFIELSK